MVSVFLESLFLQCIWKRSSHQKHVPSSVKWKLKSVERCYGGLWMGAEHKVSPVLASTCNATHLVQKVHKRTHLWREKEKTAGLRVERGRTPLLCEEQALPSDRGTNNLQAAPSSPIQVNLPSQLCRANRSSAEPTGVRISAFLRSNELWEQRQETGHLKCQSAHTAEGSSDYVPKNVRSSRLITGSKGHLEQEW